MRRLTLKSEALTDLTAAELSEVAGGDATQVCPVVTNLASLCHLCQIFTQQVC